MIEVIVKVTMKDKKTAYFKIQEGQSVTVGRSSNSNITLEDNFCSSEHCTFRVENGFFIVKDLDSKNGTIVNGNKTSESHLFINDEVRIGDTLFEIAKDKLCREMKKHFRYKSERHGTEFMTLPDLSEESETPVEKIDLEKSIKKTGPRFSDMKKKKDPLKGRSDETILQRIGKVFKK